MARSHDKDADVVIMLGNRFDDNLTQTIDAARKLMQEKKTRIFAIPNASASADVKEAYKQIAYDAGGVSIPVDFGRGAEKEYATIVREVTNHTISKVTGAPQDLNALPAPDETTRRLRLALQRKP